MSGRQKPGATGQAAGRGSGDREVATQRGATATGRRKPGTAAARPQLPEGHRNQATAVPAKSKGDQRTATKFMQERVGRGNSRRATAWTQQERQKRPAKAAAPQATESGAAERPQPRRRHKQGVHEGTNRHQRRKRATTRSIAPHRTSLVRSGGERAAAGAAAEQQERRDRDRAALA